MRQEDLQGHQGYEQMTTNRSMELAVHEVESYIQEVYQKIIIAFKKSGISMKNLKSLKETDICVQFQDRQKFSEIRQQEQFCDCIEQKEDSKIQQNLFTGSNPGLFYSKHSIFEQVSFNLKNQQKLVSIGNLFSVLPSEKNFQNQIFQNSLQISGDTILDITTQKDVPQQSFIQKEEDQNKLCEIQMVNQQSTYYIPQNRLSKHSKYCDMILTPVKKQKDFIVPVLKNENRHNKSQINKQQYFHLNDKNLTKFFVPQQKRKYVETFGNESKSRIKDNQSEFSKSPFKQNIEGTDKTFRRSNMKKIGNTCRNSTASNPNFKSNHFESHQQNKSCGFNTTNTKFLIKVLPSDKTKKLFNQSVSTFINHNYRPITCRKQFRKNAQSETTNKQISVSQIKTLNNQVRDMRKLKQNLSCDDIALKNSFKKMNYNSKRGKKINLFQIQKQPKSLFMRQKNFKPLVTLNKDNEQQIILPNPIQKTYIDSKNQYVFKNQNMRDEKQQKQSMSRITISTKNHQNKYKNFTQMQLEMIKNNNIKRIEDFKKTANSKLNIVTKMGVKISPD